MLGEGQDASARRFHGKNRRSVCQIPAGFRMTVEARRLGLGGPKCASKSQGNDTAFTANRGRSRRQIEVRPERSKALTSRYVHLAAAALIFTIFIVVGTACDNSASQQQPADEVPEPTAALSQPAGASSKLAAIPAVTPHVETPEPATTPSVSAYDPIENPWALTGGVTTLHWAVLLGNADAAEFDLNRGGDIDAKAGIRNRDTGVSRSEVTPLHVAALTNADTRLIELLLDEGADVHSKSDFGDTPLHLWALANTKHSVADLLLENGADLEARDNIGMTSLFYAALNGSPIPANLLMEKGADVYVIDDLKGTVLHSAAGHNSNPEVAALFLDRGVDVNARDSYGAMPYHYALRFNPNPEVTGLLSDKGLDK